VPLFHSHRNLKQILSDPVSHVVVAYYGPNSLWWMEDAKKGQEFKRNIEKMMLNDKFRAVLGMATMIPYVGACLMPLMFMSEYLARKKADEEARAFSAWYTDYLKGLTNYFAIPKEYYDDVAAQWSAKALAYWNTGTLEIGAFGSIPATRVGDAFIVDKLDDKWRMLRQLYRLEIDDDFEAKVKYGTVGWNAGFLETSAHMRAML